MMKEQDETMEEKINYIHELIKEVYGEAIAVKILVTYEGIEVSPEYRTNLKGKSMMNINGKWIKGTIN